MNDNAAFHRSSAVSGGLALTCCERIVSGRLNIK